MALNPRNRRPRRTLLALFALVIGLYAVLGAVSTWGEASRTPKLGLDLEGGTQVVLLPVVVGSQKPSPEQIAQAVTIIRQRVDAQGVSEAEVTTQGGQNIVVSMPGTINQTTRDALEKSSQLRFRAVLEAAPNATPQPTPTVTATTKPSSTPSSTPSGSATTKPSATSSAKPSTSPSATAKPSASTARSGLPQALRAATPSPITTAKPTTAKAVTTPSKAAATPAPTTTTTATPGAKPKDASDLAWVTPALQQEFTALDCTKAVKSAADDPAKPMVACADDKTVKYVLGPAEVLGKDITNATSGLRQTSTGTSTTEYEVNLQFDSKGAQAFGDVTSRLVALPAPRNQFGIVLDNLVISAPVPQAALTSGSASITGNFTADTARALADQLKFGALPMSFQPQTEEQISPTLGGDQLHKGLLAGLIGLLLVVVYSLFQYRALGFVTVASLLVASSLTYAAVTLLGWAYDFRLTMAGVTGLIVSIGVTADSFIIYFERVRDEVRDGRQLRAAVETGWARARRTVLISDTVNFLAAIVLYILASSNVRGFAFTLMVTTIIDVLVVFLFTHPLVSILATTEFFGQGHKWSGLDPEHLGAKTTTYAGRGRVTIAARRAAAEGGQS